jgi:uncharacterized protein (DUF58 family)
LPRARAAAGRACGGPVLTVRTSGRKFFPLVSRRQRLVGVPFGEQRSARRGRGSDIAGSRVYEPGDPVSTIDWYGTARLSSASGRDEFLVHTRFADEAPRVVIVCDQAPAMALFEPPFPWLSKATATAVATRMIGASAVAARADAGYLDFADTRPFWIPPGTRGHERLVRRRREEVRFNASPDNLAKAMDFLFRRQRDLPPGVFLFVLSDFLVTPPTAVWTRALAAGWDPVPVVIQDPTWEQSFPDLSGVLAPVADLENGKVRDVRLRRSEARHEKAVNEGRLRGLLSLFSRLRLDPVLLGTSNEYEILRAFLGWAERRRLARRIRR